MYSRQLLLIGRLHDQPITLSSWELRDFNGYKVCLIIFGNYFLTASQLRNLWIHMFYSIQRVSFLQTLAKKVLKICFQICKRFLNFLFLINSIKVIRILILENYKWTKGLIIRALPMRKCFCSKFFFKTIEWDFEGWMLEETKRN